MANADMPKESRGRIGHSDDREVVMLKIIVGVLLIGLVVLVVAAVGFGFAEMIVEEGR